MHASDLTNYSMDQPDAEEETPYTMQVDTEYY